MKNPITKMRHRAAVLFTFLLIFNSHLKAQYFPDEEIFDTTGIIQETLTDGMDTVWYWGLDEEELETGENYRTSSGMKKEYFSNNYSQYAKVHGDSTIYVNLGSNINDVNQGQYGFHIAGIFGRKQIPNDSSALDQWNWMSDLAPASLRFPGGADSKFMHLLEGPGYGYDLEEIIRFYDRTDGVDNAPIFDTIVEALNINTTLDSFYLSWMHVQEVGDFKGFGGRWLDEQILDSTHRHIDDFIEMIQKIETENPGHTVDVVVDLNIMNETASDCRAIVEYLRDNPTHDVNVVYVELGNEMYYKFSEKMLGIYELEDYWIYINGGITDSLDSVLIGGDVWSDHDYIAAFKTDPEFTCKIALPTENIHDTTFALFAEAKIEGTYNYSDWNDSLFTKRLEKVEITGEPGHYRKAFDAYAIHPYYETKNYDTISFNHLESTYSCSLGDTLGWLYDTYDTRLEDAFDGIAKNFKAFNKTWYLESWDLHKVHLGLNLSISLGGKDVITSEYNFKDSGNGYTATQINQIGVYGQSFVHCVMLQEWWLKNLKLNYNSNYRRNFFKYAHLHNYAGGSNSTLMSPAKRPNELDSIGKNIYPYNEPIDSVDARNYYIKRATFFVMQLLSEISKQNLSYLQCNFTIARNNINVQPTVFIDSAKTNLFIYFTNSGDESQQIQLNLSGTTGIYAPDGLLYISDTATIYSVIAKKPYSTSGRGQNTLFVLNECYNNINDVHYSIEITQIDTFKNAPSSGDPLLTLEVLPYSFGYIRVPIAADYPPYEKVAKPTFSLNLYPNPANLEIKVHINGESYDDLSIFNVQIVNLQGVTCYSSQLQNNHKVDISQLSAGVYLMTIELRNGIRMNKQFVKL